jgi:RsiW-degrading membrane proteinase PrsW (M82 family)
MSIDLLLAAIAGLLPSILFLLALTVLDSYKLVSLRQILVLIAFGGLAALVSFFANDLVAALTHLPDKPFARYVAPVIEESAKAVVLISLLRGNRIGFPVDAAIFGFAVGSGFAIIENLYFLQIAADMPIGLWLIRGFGTAIMHGGVAAIFCVSTHTLSEQKSTADLSDATPGLFLAILCHSLYNHFVVSPWLSTLIVIVLLPVVAMFVFRLSEKALEHWLNVGFDGDTELLEVINSGELSNSNVGRYLASVKHRFQPAVVVDLICYLRLHVELALRAKGVLMARENGFEMETDPSVRATLEELKVLEASIGTTGKLALKPFLQLSRKDLWQIYVLEK